MNGPRTWFAAAWEHLVAVQARGEEEARLGRLFNTLMVISLGIGAATWLFAGVSSPAWVLFIWTVTVVEILFWIAGQARNDNAQQCREFRKHHDNPYHEEDAE